MSTRLVSKNSQIRTLVTLMALFFLQIIYSKNVKDSITYSGSQIYIGAFYNFQHTIASTNEYDTLKHSFIRLKIDDYIAPYHWYRYSIQLTITPLDGQPPYIHTMTVENNRYGDFGNFIDLQMHEISNAPSFSIVVNNIEFVNLETNQQLNVTPSNISLSLIYEAERYIELASQPEIIIQKIFVDYANELLLSWNSIVGAEEYDLEWTWIDNFSSTSLNSSLTSSQIILSERDFQLNSTRIQTKNLNYRIPLIYSKGFLVYRIRAIGFANVNTTLDKKYSKWNVVTNPSEDPNYNSTIAGWGENNYFEITAVNQHETKKNWQFQSSYAEQGKKKDVISYFDGSLRNRQTVTKTNSSNKIIVGEVIYDEEGRPAVEVLPVPSTESKLFYHQNFNRNIAGHPYAFQDFSSETSCTVLAGSMATTNGASKYYSSSSNFEDDNHRFVPIADGFPFSQIDYTADNTGRIKRKGGVGITHRLGSNHEMKYFYSTPNQEELNRLFGYNVGFSSHYKKNIVIDPNDQSSISYIDPHGRTIATALLSENPGNMIELDDEKSTTLHQPITFDLLNKLTVGAVDTPLDNNQTFKTESSFNNLINGLEYSKQLALLNATNYTFNYSLSKSNPFVFACKTFNYSYPFVYDLKIKVMDDCNSIIQNFNYVPPTNPYSYDANGNITFNAPNPLTISHQFSVAPTKTATFGVEKKLSVNQQALDAFAEDYIKKGIASGCIFTPYNINESLDGCETTCTLCKQYYNNLTYTTVLGQVLTGQNAYIQQMLDSNFDLLQLSSSSPEYAPLVNALTIKYSAEFTDYLAQCDLPCNLNGYVTGGATSLTSIDCSNKLTQLLDDVSPNGQYGHFQTAIGADGTVGVTTTQNAIDYLTLPISLYNDNSNSTTLNRMFSVVEGINPEQINWRNPHYYNHNGVVLSTDLRHYFTSIGAIDYVTITKVSDNTFSPPVVNPSLAILIEGTTYKIEPQFLANVNDFVIFMQSRPSWNLSLVKYHPEFHYLDYTMKSCGVLKESTIINSEGQSVTMTSNSDGFDSILATYDTFAKAQSASLLLNSTSISTLDPFFDKEHPLDGKRVRLNGTIGNYTVDVLPPTGINQLPVDYKNFKQSFLNAALDNYEQTGKSMAYVAYSSTFCDGISNNCLPIISPTASFTQIITAIATSTADVSDKDLFWQNYLSMYFTLKQKLKSLFLNVYGYRQGFYNECIGNNNSESVNKITSIIKEYPTFRNFVSSNYINSGLLNGNGNTLKAKSGAYLKEHSKRFIPFDVLYDSQKSASDLYSELSSAANANYYASTGICPMVRDLEMFLNGIKSKAHFNNYLRGVQPLISSYPMPFLTPSLFASLGGNYNPINIPSNTYEISSSLTGAGKDLTLTFKQGGNIFTIVLKITGSNTKTWNDYKNLWSISTFKNTAFTTYDSTIGTGVYRFATIAQTQSIQNPSELFEILIEGYSKAVLQCSSNNVTATDTTNGIVSIGVGQDSGFGCTKKKDFTIALNELVLHLKSINQIEPIAADGYDLANDPVFMNGYLYEYFGISNQINYIKWKYANILGVNSYQIAIGQNSTNSQIRMTIQNVNLNQNIFALWIGDLTQSQNEHTFKVLNYSTVNPFSFVNVQLQSGLISATGNINPLDFACCRNYSTNSQVLSLGDFFEATKNAYNEIIHFVMDHVSNNLEVPSTYNSPAIQYLANFYLSNEDFGIYNLNYLPNTQTGLYKISFEHATTYNALCIVPTVIESNVPFLDNNNYNYIESVINGQYNHYLVNLDPWNSNYIGLLQTAMASYVTYFKFVMENGHVGDYGGVRNGCVNLFSNLPQCPCVPQVTQPVDCDSKYQQYLTHLTSFGLEFPVPIAGKLNRDVFCELNLQYSFGDYLDYLNEFGITNSNYSENTNYISLTDFAGTNLNGGYDDFDVVIEAYHTYIITFVAETIDSEEESPTNLAGVNGYVTQPLSWQAFVNQYLVEHSEICPPAPLFSNLQDPNPPFEYPCENLNINIILAYNQAAYLEYINQIKTIFKTSYLKKAIEDVTETFTMTNADKEYQYTLYYYDQAGNLTQTVAPQGVQRLATTLNPSINQFRSLPQADNTALLPNHSFKTQYQYNSLNQLVWQSTPDGGQTRFAYDLLGRIVASQNAVQNTIVNENGLPIVLPTAITRTSGLTFVKTLNNSTWYGANTSSTFTHKNIIASFTVEQNSRDRNIMFGLAYANNPTVTTIDFAFNIGADGKLYRRNGTTNVLVQNGVPNGTILELHRTNGKVNMYVNNILVHQYSELAANVSKAMLLDFAIGNFQAQISNVLMESYGSATKFSYTRYDELGRIFEAGEFINSIDSPLSIDSNGILRTYLTNQAVTVDAGYPYTISSSRNEVTKTLYDNYMITETDDLSSVLQNPSNNTRNRVTAVLTYPTGIQAATNYETGIFYNYDIHGNVDQMVQSVSNSILDSQTDYTLKRVHYEYDLISGNVNKVYYQKNEPDQFIHKYNYDADNRIVNVETSNNNIVWEKDAAYEYYDHGPLARVVLGDKKVQGVDYAYTLQGWLKNVNSENLANENKDMGVDGNYVSKDAFGYSLSYFNGDYAARHLGGNQANSVSANSAFQGVELFNGNINRMITSVRNTSEDVLPTQVNLYRYDQLNRIFSMNSFSGTENSSNVFTHQTSYSSSYEYDKNGNLKKLNRTAPKIGFTVPQPMDALVYNYSTGTNRLRHVTDVTNSAAFTVDIDNQIADNYDYDNIGQLIKDAQEGISKGNITWRVDGKVKSIIKANDQIVFFYDGLGNRIAKKSNNSASQGGTKTTHYTRDAQGNTMAVYNQLITPQQQPEYKLGEHHIYGSSRLGLQEYGNDGSNTNDMRRVVGDKRYELSNHLGNVLSVINDRKIVDEHMELVHSEFFDGDPQFTKFGEVASEITADYQLMIETLSADAGCFIEVNLDSSKTYSLQMLVTVDPGNTVLVKVVDSDLSTLTSQMVSQSGNVLLNFTTQTSGNHQIILVNDENNPVTTFYLDNIYLYYIPQASNDFVTLFKPDVLAYNDYYPFGMLVPNRHGSSESYRYGFQGQEKDEEIKGEGNSLNYTFRMHDPRVGRFFAVDPLFKEYPDLTPYQFASNSVIDMIEIEGLEGGWIVNNQFEVSYVAGPRLNVFDSEQAAKLAASYRKKTPQEFKSFQEYLSRIPSTAKPQAQLRSDNLDNQVNKFRGVNPGLAISRGVLDGAQEAPMVVIPEMIISKGSKAYVAFKQAKIAVNAAKSADEIPKVNIVLKYKDGWSAEQKAAAAEKVKALSEADTYVVKNPQRASNLRNRYKKAGKSVEPTEDVDHIVDLQLGGADDVLTNTKPLDASVNRSLGKQINDKIKDLPAGTKIDKIIIE